MSLEPGRHRHSSWPLPRSSRLPGRRRHRHRARSTACWSSSSQGSPPGPARRRASPARRLRRPAPARARRDQGRHDGRDDPARRPGHLRPAGRRRCCASSPTRRCGPANAPDRPTPTAAATTACAGWSGPAALLGSVPTYALLASRYLAVTGHRRARSAPSPSPRGTGPCATRRAVDRARRSTCDGYAPVAMISTPLRVLDCARPVNGAAAVLVSDRLRSATAADLRARHGSRPPGAAPARAGRVVVRRRRPRRRRRAGQAGLRPRRHRRGRALRPVQRRHPVPARGVRLRQARQRRRRGAGRRRSRPGGPLPTNTGGGQLSGFYLQGMTPLIEAIEQLRGTGGARQVAGASTAFVGGIGGRMDHHACARSWRRRPHDRRLARSSRLALAPEHRRGRRRSHRCMPAAARGELALPFCAACDRAARTRAAGLRPLRRHRRRAGARSSRTGSCTPRPSCTGASRADRRDRALPGPRRRGRPAATGS